MIALIGSGYWGKNIARTLENLGVSYFVCDKDENAAKNLKGGKISFEDILRNKEINAVLIATPAGTHYEIAKKCLQSGKNVFVEKPLALKVEHGDDLVKMSCQNNLVLMVGHLLNYHPAIIKLKELIGRGELGEIRYIWSNRLNFGKLRPEENVLWSFAPHDISVILSILGMPEKVFAMGRAYLNKNIPDSTLSVLEYKGNVAAHIFVSWLNPFKEQKFSVIGSKKMAVFDGISDELVIYPHEIKIKNDKSFEAVKAEGKLLDFEKIEPLRAEIEHFMDCVKNKKEPVTAGKEGLDVLKVLGLCQDSLNKNSLWQ